MLPPTVEYPLPVGEGGGNGVAPLREMCYDAHRLTHRHTVLCRAHRLASPPLVCDGPHRLASPRAVLGSVRSVVRLFVALYGILQESNTAHMCTGAGAGFITDRATRRVTPPGPAMARRQERRSTGAMGATPVPEDSSLLRASLTGKTAQTAWPRRQASSSRRTEGVQKTMTRSQAPGAAPATQESQHGSGRCPLGETRALLASQAPPHSHGSARETRLAGPPGRA